MLTGRVLIGDAPLAGKDAREMRGYLEMDELHNGANLHWFVLEGWSFELL